MFKAHDALQVSVRMHHGMLCVTCCIIPSWPVLEAHYTVHSLGPHFMGVHMVERVCKDSAVLTLHMSCPKCDVTLEVLIF